MQQYQVFIIFIGGYKSPEFLEIYKEIFNFKYKIIVLNKYQEHKIIEYHNYCLKNKKLLFVQDYTKNMFLLSKTYNCDYILYDLSLFVNIILDDQHLKIISKEVTYNYHEISIFLLNLKDNILTDKEIDKFKYINQQTKLKLQLLKSKQVLFEEFLFEFFPESVEKRLIIRCIDRSNKTESSYWLNYLFELL